MVTVAVLLQACCGICLLFLCVDEGACVHGDVRASLIGGCEVCRGGRLFPCSCSLYVDS